MQKIYQDCQVYPNSLALFLQCRNEGEIFLIQTKQQSLTQFYALQVLIYRILNVSLSQYRSEYSLSIVQPGFLDIFDEFIEPHISDA